MEHLVDENVVMRFYLEQIQTGKVSFLRENETSRQQIAGMIQQLLSTSKMNSRIAVAKKLWKALFEVAMSSLDPDKQGYDKIFAYFDEYVEFEELIFASDSFYRDHTLHCIWVYFLGEYVARKPEFGCLFEASRANTDFFRAIKGLVALIAPTLETHEIKELAKACAVYEKIEEKSDAMRCISALTHDLGYPLKKIEKINKSIRKILPYYSVESLGDFRFEYGTLSQYFIDTFLKTLNTHINVAVSVDDPKAEALLNELLYVERSNVVGINQERTAKLTKEEKELLSKEIKVSFYAAHTINNEMYTSNDLESYQHGIMSAFLLAKNVHAFQNLKLDLSLSMKPEPEALLNYQCKQSILRSITLHTCSSYRIRNIGDESFLTFIDELEEFSRISRASQSREYIEEFCASEIYMDGNWFCVDFTFENSTLEGLDPGKAFRSRCKRLLGLFDIPRLDENLKLRLRCIGKLEHDHSIYQLEIARKHAKIWVDGVEQEIPAYLKSSQFYTSEAYAKM